MTTQLEHAELLRVAELAAGGAEPNAVFAAVVAAASTVLGGRQARVIRLTDDGPSPVPGGGRLTTTRTPFDAALAQVTAEVRRRGHAARLDVEGAGKVAESAEAVGVPIGVDSRLWGVLAAGPAGTPLPPDAERLLAPLAAICAAVVAGTLARDGLRALAEEQTALLRVAELVAKGANPTELFDAVAREASRLIADEPTTLGRFEGPRTYTVVAGHRSPAPIGTRIQVAPDDEGLVAEMLQTRSPARLDDHRTRRGPSYARDDFAVLSSVGAPILVDDGIWGFVCGTSDGRRFPADAEQRLQRFAGLITSALANAQARVQLQELADEQAALRRVAELVARAAPPTEVFTAVATEASGLLDGQAMTLTRFGGDAELVVVAVHGGPAPVGQRIAFEPDTLPDRIRRGAAVVRVDDYTRERDAELATTFNLAAAVSAPIVVEGTVWGMLTATSDQQPLQPGTEGRLEQFAQLVAAALANSQARSELQAMADEQAALHRVAELVARGAAPEEVFVAVTNEASALLGDLAAALMLYDDAGAVVVASCNCPAPVGLHVPFSAGTAVDQLFRTGRPAQVATYEGTVLADVTRELGIASTTAVPITVEGRVRAALVSSSTGPPVPAGVEARLTPFAELAAVAIANAETKAKLTASRARVVATADETRRRLQRDVHDGAQQRLVHTIIALKLARQAQAAGDPATDLIDEALTHAQRASTELRDIVHGILPAALTHSGLRSGLESLVADLALPVDVHVATPRLPPATETTAYFVVAEALTNVVKHAHAHQASVRIALDGDTLTIEVRDDGIGGADPARGTGLTGLLDRIDAAEGTLTIASPAELGTTLRVALPVEHTRP